MSHRVERQFAIEHPTAAGHFPGNPLIPGAVLLDEVLSAIAAHDPGAAQRFEIRSAKFVKPVRPGARVVIRWKTLANGEIRFDCLLAEPERLALTGTLRPSGRSP